MRPVRELTLAAGLLLLCASTPLTAIAQGGPPFRSEDPETPGSRHFDVNLGFIGDRNRHAGDYEVPNFDFNYGLGPRMQLKYELPIVLAETRSIPATGGEPAQSERVLGGLGESLLGVKLRFYQHHPGERWVGRSHADTAAAEGAGETAGNPKKNEDSEGTEEPEVNFSLALFPRLALDNPTRSVARGVVVRGPDSFVPLEMNARLGPLRFDGEAGYHFTNRDLPQSWSRGLLLGREFRRGSEAYLELYDQQDANRIAGAPKQRETTLGLGGRQALNRRQTVSLLIMGGRAIQSVSAANSQPGWIAYVGLAMVFGPKSPPPTRVESKPAAEER